MVFTGHDSTQECKDGVNSGRLVPSTQWSRTLFLDGRHNAFNCSLINSRAGTCGTNFDTVSRFLNYLCSALGPIRLCTKDRYDLPVRRFHPLLSNTKTHLPPNRHASPRMFRTRLHHIPLPFLHHKPCIQQERSFYRRNQYLIRVRWQGIVLDITAVKCKRKFH